MSISKEDFARQHLARMGNDNPSDEAVEVIISLIDDDQWVAKLYQRANAMTAEIYERIPTIQPEEPNVS